MVEKEGTVDEADALKAYKAAREESDHAAEVAIGYKVSSALIDRVSLVLLWTYCPMLRLAQLTNFVLLMFMLVG